MGRTRYTKTSVDVPLEIATFDLVCHVVAPERKVRETRKELKSSPKLSECQGFLLLHVGVLGNC